MNNGVYLATLIDKRLTSVVNPLIWLRQNIDKVLYLRTKNNVKRKDYIQILLECLSDDVDKRKDKGDVDFTQTKVDKKMTLDVSLQQMA